MPQRIAITGASGFIGQHLAERLARDGRSVQRIVRHEPRLVGDVRWDAREWIDADALEGVDAVVHLAGESVNQRWTAASREKIYRSRADGTALLARTLAKLRAPPKVLVSASAQGIYGDRGDELLDESAPLGEGFLADVCKAWEAATQPAADAGIRVVNTRTGIVVGRGGGALQQMLLPYRAGVGGRIADGRAWWSWIDLDDEVGAIVHAIDTPTLSGPVNLVAPHAVRSEEFTRTLARVLHRPHVFPVPAAGLRALFGEMADEVLLASAHVVPRKLQETGYTFRHEDVASSLRAQLGAK